MPKSRKRPHILLFNPDQWRGDVIGHLGNPAVHTPHLDKLVSEDGVSFSQTFCQSPVCTPSRCSFMTGWYPQVRGHRTMHHMLHHEAGEENLLRTLKKAGYYVWWAGKNDLVPGSADFSEHCDVRYFPKDSDYSRWQVTSRPDTHGEDQGYRGDPESDNYYSMHIGKLPKGNEPIYANSDWWRVLATRDFIRNYDGDQPLCIFLPLQYPHPPYAVEEPWYSMTKPDAIPQRYPEPEDLDNRPLMMRGILENQNFRGWTEDQWSRLRATYYGMCARSDHQFGLVLEAMKERGFYDDTAVFFFSDHGDFTGDYGIVEKAQNLFYDCLVRVPLVVRPPLGHTVQPGTRTAMVELLDIYATILEIAGLEAPHWHFSQSLWPLVSGESRKGRDAVFCMGGRLPGEAQATEKESADQLEPDGLYWPRISLQQVDDPPYHTKACMIRTDTHKYVHRLYEKDELYDLRNDPAESHNIVDDPTARPDMEGLRGRLLSWFLESSDVVPLQPDSR